MSQKDELISMLSEARASRRSVIQKAAAGTLALAAGAILPGCGGSSNSNGNPGGSNNPSPADVLNFALNLEYLEAEYYSFGVNGLGLSAADTGNSGSVVSGDVFPTGSKVSFSKYGELAAELAQDELQHVRFLRTALGSAAVPRPAIDLVGSFNAAAKAAHIGSSFNPFANETNFILGGFVFEDVGVTAYRGAAGYLQSTPNYLAAAAGILGTEAYHGGAIRQSLIAIGGSVLNTANMLSALRASADQAAGGSGNEEAPGTTSAPVISPSDSNSIAFARTFAEVLSIVYLTAKPFGGFFPHGLNGKIK